MLNINNLTVQSDQSKKLLNQVSLALPQGDIIGLTGASGSGKTTLIRQILGLSNYDCRKTQGTITIDGMDTENLSSREMRRLCGTVVGYIPQSPMTVFDPRLTIGLQMSETFRFKRRLKKKESMELAKHVLEQVNLMDATRVIHSYPSQLSGGMLQRVAFAILIGLKVRYILADEPTSALDEENSKLLISLFRTSKAGILFVSHDAFALRTLCAKLYIMQQGEIVEKGNTEQLLENPKQEWTKQFIKASKKQNRGEWSWTEFQ